MERQLDPELGTLRGRALEPHAPLHQLRQALRDGEPDPGALDWTGLLPRALERKKELVLLVEGNTEASIDDRHA